MRRLVASFIVGGVVIAGGTPAIAATSHATVVKHTKKVVKKHKKHKKVAVASPAITPITIPTAASITSAHLSTYEARLLVDVNAARADAGLPALKAVDGATDVARRWTLGMAHDGTLHHNPNLVADMSAAGSDGWHALAENVGMASGNNADEIFNAYMQSPGHKANILSAKARYVGIGAIETSDAGGVVTYDTMTFTDYYSAAYGAPRTTITDLLDTTGLSTIAGLWGITV
jgi:uncharacterized protein YkwD